VGIHNVPGEFVTKILSFDCQHLSKDKHGKQIGRQRPAFLDLKKYLLRNLKSLMKIMPEVKSTEQADLIISQIPVLQ